MAVPGRPDERLAYVNPAFVSDLYYYETGAAEAVPESSASNTTANNNNDDKNTSTSSSDTNNKTTSSENGKPTLSSAVVAAAILEKQTSFKELSEKLSNAAVSGQPGAGSSSSSSSKEKEKEESGKPAAPDGGCLAWAIVAASFMVSFLQVSARRAIYILFCTKSCIVRITGDLCSLHNGESYGKKILFPVCASQGTNIRF